MIKVTSKEHYDQVLKEAGNKLVVIDFYADWCGPCKMIAPKLVEWSKEFTDVVFAKVNVDDNEIEEIVGANESRLREFIEKHK